MERELSISVSVGASVYPQHEQDAERAAARRGCGAVSCQELGRSQLSMFTPELLEAAAPQIPHRAGLRRAIERGEFELLFQPEVNVRLIGTKLVEALLRWRLPDGRPSRRRSFWPSPKSPGSSCQISEWVLRSAVEAAAKWHHGPWPECAGRHQCLAAPAIRSIFVERSRILLAEYQLPRAASRSS